MRKNVLEMLRNAGESFISGEDMATRLKISRTAVWKHIQKLRNGGYDIISRENRGYKLNRTPDLLSPDVVLNGLQTKIIGAGAGKYIYRNVVDSTNKIARQAAYEGAADGTVIVAEEQTGGKGRLERPFFSPREKGIYFSLLLRPKCLPKDASKFTLPAAVALAKTMERFDLKPEIKWPNDVMFDGRKIAGILTELSAEIGRVNYIVVGTGINVNVSRKEFPRNIRKVAASLSEMKGEDLPRADFFRALLEEFDKIYISINEEGFGKVFDLWRKYNITLGKNVNVISAESGETFQGVAVDIDSDGALIVETKDGRRTVYAGDVSIRNAE